MTPLTGPALLRAAAERLEALDREAAPGPWERFENHGRDICDEAWSEIGVKSSNELRIAETFDDTRYSDRSHENMDLITVTRSLVPDLAAWLRTVAADAEANGWVNSDGTFRLGTATAYPTAIARKVIGQ